MWRIGSTTSTNARGATISYNMLICFVFARVLNHSLWFLRRPYGDNLVAQLNGYASSTSQAEATHATYAAHGDDGLTSVPGIPGYL